MCDRFQNQKRKRELDPIALCNIGYPYEQKIDLQVALDRVIFDILGEPEAQESVVNQKEADVDENTCANSGIRDILAPRPIAPTGVVTVVDSIPLANSAICQDVQLQDLLDSILQDCAADIGSDTEALDEHESFIPSPKRQRQDDNSMPFIDNYSLNNDLLSSQTDSWGERYQELCRFKEKNGHCLVPHNWNENPSLASWVKRQRHQFKLANQGKHTPLTSARMAALEQVGFVWNSHEASWSARFDELSEFKKSFGHTNVPSSYPSNQQLAAWVKFQRRQHKLHCQGKRSTLTPTRIARLDSLGFKWNPRNQPPLY